MNHVPFGIDYAHQKAQEAVRALAVSPSPLPARLKAVLSPVLVGIGACKKNLPPDVLTSYRLIEDRLTSVGKAESALDSLLESEAIEVAAQIVDLAYEIASVYRKEFPDPW